MSRHRDVRSLKLEDEDDFDDVYGHSVEEDYGVSPATANQFMYDRSHANRSLSSFVTEEEIPEEDEDLGEGEAVAESGDSKSDSFTYQKPKLSDVEQAMLNSCLDQMRSVLGDFNFEHVLINAAIEAGFDPERALNLVLNTAGNVPKPQRQARERTPKALKDFESKDHFGLAEEVRAAAKVESLKPFAPTVIVRSDLQRVKSDSQFDKFAELPKAKSDARLNVAPSEDKPQSSTPISRPGSSASSPVHDVISTPKKDGGLALEAITSIPKSASKSKLQDQLDLKKEYEKRRAEKGKDHINMVVVGHVDAGKSTLMGHLLYQLGFVSKKTMHKYETESRKLGKASFAYAWVLDETEEERSRGVTMDVAQTQFETSSKLVTLLDAPGHKDFIPNMITGAAQADVAILVVNATRGEFESGFDAGGQTREHAMLIRSLGITQLCVAVNKMDTVDWLQERFDDVVSKLSQFLRQTGFKQQSFSFVPCSGLSGDNLTKAPIEAAQQAAWYTGATLVSQIDSFQPPIRPIDRPLRMCVTDVFKGAGVGVQVSGTVQQGALQAGDRLIIMPQGEAATVKGLSMDEIPVQCAFAGDSVSVTLTGADMNNVAVGSVLSDVVDTIRVASRLEAQIVIFNIDLPITCGFPVVFHYQALTLPAVVKRLISQLNRNTGEVVKKKPRCLTKNMSAVVEIELSAAVCMELYRDCRDLGRFMLRHAGATIAAGLVTEIASKIAGSS